MRKLLLIFTILLNSSVVFSQGTFFRSFDFPKRKEKLLSETVGHKGYLMLGIIAGGIMLNEVWEYDELSGVWTQKNNFPGPTHDWRHLLFLWMEIFTSDAVITVPCVIQMFGNTSGYRLMGSGCIFSRNKQRSICKFQLQWKKGISLSGVFHALTIPVLMNSGSTILLEINGHSGLQLPIRFHGVVRQWSTTKHISSMKQVLSYMCTTLQLLHGTLPGRQHPGPCNISSLCLAATSMVYPHFQSELSEVSSHSGQNMVAGWYNYNTKLASGPMTFMALRIQWKSSEEVPVFPHSPLKSGVLSWLYFQSGCAAHCSGYFLLWPEPLIWLMPARLLLQEIPMHGNGRSTQLFPDGSPVILYLLPITTDFITSVYLVRTGIASIPHLILCL